MINYEVENSPFFEANKNYVESIEGKMKTLNAECTGFCNCFGYDVETSVSRNGLEYELKFHKHQSTQNGVVVPVNSNIYSGTEVRVKGLNRNAKVSIGKSKFMRLFAPKMVKDLFESPYYMKSNFTPDSGLLEDLAKKIKTDRISMLSLSDGQLTIKIHVQTEDPLALMADLEKLTKNWK